MGVPVVVGVAIGVAVAGAASLRARTQTGVLIAALLWLLGAILLGLFVVFDATPCGPFSGDGFLTASPECRVQPVHIVDAIVGGASFVALLTAGGGGLVYAQAGASMGHKTFRIALLVAVALLLVLVASDIALPRQHPSD